MQNIISCKYLSLFGTVVQPLQYRCSRVVICSLNVFWNCLVINDRIILNDYINWVKNNAGVGGLS